LLARRRELEEEHAEPGCAAALSHDRQAGYPVSAHISRPHRGIGKRWIAEHRAGVQQGQRPYRRTSSPVASAITGASRS
jgi:hypothetical protein